MYQIAKKGPEVECFEVTPESSPETVVSYITATEEEEEGPKQKNLGARFAGRLLEGCSFKFYFDPCYSHCRLFVVGEDLQQEHCLEGVHSNLYSDPHCSHYC